MIPALAALLLCQLVGEATVRLMGLPVPGPVLGLALLLVALWWRPAWLGTVKPAAQGILQHLSLLFVPAGVGVMQHLQRLGDEALAIGVALVVSALVGLVVTAVVMLWLMRLSAKRQGEPHDER